MRSNQNDTRGGALERFGGRQAAKAPANDHDNREMLAHIYKETCRSAVVGNVSLVHGGRTPAVEWTATTSSHFPGMATVHPGTLLPTFRGEVAGEIVDEPCGSSEFGCDPYFLYQPFRLTFAEIARERKLAVSHRGRAVGRMRD